MSEQKAASNLTAQEIYNFADRIQVQLPSNPKAPAAVSALDALGDSLLPPPPTPPWPPIFRRINKTYEQVFGHSVDTTQGWWSDVNIQAQPSNIECIVIPFVAPANRQCALKSSNLSANGVMAVCESPGGFTRTTGWSMGAPQTTPTDWTTVSGKRGLVLTAGRTYYLHLTSFDVPHYLSTGVFKPLIIGNAWDKYMSQAVPV